MAVTGDFSARKVTLDRQAVITLALLYLCRDEYPDEEEPYVKIAKDLLRTEFGVRADRVAELNRIVKRGLRPAGIGRLRRREQRDVTGSCGGRTASTPWG